MAQEVIRWIRPACGLTLLSLVLASAVVIRGSAERAQNPPPTPPPASTQQAKAPAKTTMSGVYTTAQATHGEETYLSACASCHKRGTYSGDAFTKMWNGRPLSDLFEWISEKMPKDNPGSLTMPQSAEVLAYILQQNGMPAGQTELPADSEALGAIVIQIGK